MHISFPTNAVIPFSRACVGCGAPSVSHIPLDCSAGVELGGAGWRSLVWLPAPACARCSTKHRRVRRHLAILVFGLPLVLIPAFLFIPAMVRYKQAGAPSPLWLVPMLIALLWSIAFAVWFFHRGGRFVDKRVIGIESGHDHQNKWLKGPELDKIQFASTDQDIWSAPPCPWKPERPLLRAKNLVQGVGIGLGLVGILFALVPLVDLPLRVFGGFFGGLGIMMALLPGSSGADSGELTTAEEFLRDISNALRGVAWWMGALYLVAGVLGAIGSYLLATPR